MPITSDDLPALPEDAQVTAWLAVLPEVLAQVTPTLAIKMLLHVSWLRWQIYAGMLKAQVDQASASGGVRGVVGHKTAASAVMDGLYPTSEEVRALVRLEGQERDRCAKLARECHEMGVTDGYWAY